MPDNPHAECWRRDQQSQTDLLRAYEQRDELEKIIAHYRALVATPARADARDAEREALLARLDRAERERYAAEAERDALLAERDAARAAFREVGWDKVMMLAGLMKG